MLGITKLQRRNYCEPGFRDSPLLTNYFLTEVSVQFACSGVGGVVMRLCVTMGTEPFTILNGSYVTYTLYVNRECHGN